LNHAVKGNDRFALIFLIPHADPSAAASTFWTPSS